MNVTSSLTAAGFANARKALEKIPPAVRTYPLSVKEEIPWKCQRLVVGTGRYGSLPVMEEVKLEARRRKIDLLILPTEEAIQTLANQPKRTNAILHVTC